MSEPMCPRCGKAMTLNTGRYTFNEMYWAEFRHCGWTSPTEMKKTQEAAIEASRVTASKRLFKPLTLTEVLAHEGRVWIEFRVFTTANGWVDGVAEAMSWVDRAYKGMRNPEYGAHYRMWPCKPTEEERAAAPWEERNE